MCSNILYLGIPCYNEEVLHETVARLREKMKDMLKKGMVLPANKVIFINDGSKDHTWEVIQKLHKRDSLYGGINLVHYKLNS